MRAGKMRHRVAYQELSETTQPNGERTRDWVEQFTCWADVQDLTGREAMTGANVTSAVNVTVRIRYRSGVSAEGRFIDHRGRVLDIEAPTDPAQRGRELLIFCKVLSDGGITR